MTPPTLTRRPVDSATPALVLWLWGDVIVAVEHHGERQVDVGGERWWRYASRDDAAERVRCATGAYVSLDGGSGRPRTWVVDEERGRFLLGVESAGRLVDGTRRLREATTASGEIVSLLDSSRGPSRQHPFPHGTVSGIVPATLASPTMFGDVLVPAGSAIWASHVPGKVAVQFPDPPDVRDLLVLRELRGGGEP